MKRKILGLCFLSVLCLNFSTIALAEENQIESSQQITQSSSTTDSTASVSQIESQTTGNFDSEQTSDSVETEEVTVPQSQMETAEGTMSLPKGRSDLYPSIQLFASLPSVSATNTNTPSKSFIDISSHNGNISVANFQKMKGYGVTGVVVKLTEATSYTNPYAQSQINNAMAAGMKVSAYHYSWFTSDAQAVAEANYFAAAAKKFGLSSGTVMVNDIEEPQILGKGNHTNNSRAFESRLKSLGYGNVRHYIGLNWLDTGRINAATIGYKNIWVAAYPYNLSTTNFYTQYGAWQWSSQLSFPGISGNFDINADYTSTFSNPTPTPPANSVQMYRVYNPNSGEHFYTQNVAEKNNLVSKGWRYEGISWYSGGPNALHRLYNPNAKSGAHHYTLNTNEKNNLVKHGWKYEGLAWYAK